MYELALLLHHMIKKIDGTMKVASSSYCCYMFYVVCIKGSNQAAVVMNDAWMLSDGIFGFSHFWIRIAILSRLKWKRQRKFVSRI